MKKVIRILSHEDRITGRVISGGSEVSLNREVEKVLIHEIKNGFFEKKIFNNTVVARQLYLPFTLFNAFRTTPLN